MNEVKKNHRTRDHQLVRNASKKKCLSKKKELKIKQNSVSVFHRSFEPIRVSQETSVNYFVGMEIKM